MAGNTLTDRTFTNSFVVAGKKFYAADFLLLISELQAMCDELESEAVTEGGDQTLTGAKTFSGAVVISGSLSMSSKKIQNVLTPTAATDASTKGYCDTKFESMLNTVFTQDDDGNDFEINYEKTDTWEPSSGEYYKATVPGFVHFFTSNRTANPSAIRIYYSSDATNWYFLKEGSAISGTGLNIFVPKDYYFAFSTRMVDGQGDTIIATFTPVDNVTQPTIQN